MSAYTYIFQYALDALLLLITHHIPPQEPELVDPFEPRRRFERIYPDFSRTLASLLTLPPVVAARDMLELADGTIALDPPALSATRAYLQTLEQGQA